MDREERKKGRGARRIARTLFNAALMLLALGMTLALVLALAVSWYLKKNISPQFEPEEHGNELLAGASQLYYYRFEDRVKRQGEREPLPGGRLDGGVYVVPVSYAEVPRALIDAFVAIEDQQFWSHHGVNWLRTLTAGVNYALGYTRQFGASTITQQLVKNITGQSEVTIRRKLQEMCWASDLERHCTKEEILERYLNLINLSRGCFGVGAAADRFFGKRVNELTLSECAAIAAITNNPSYYDPVRFPEHTKARRDLILRTMVEEGYLDKACAEAAIAEPLVLVKQPERGAAEVHSWYVDMVVEDVIADLCATYGYDRAYAGRLLYSGGLTIETALDPEWQMVVEEYYADARHFPAIAAGQSGMIVIDPATGDILAVAGAIGQKMGDRLLNHATSARHPAASAIKPLSVYGPALELGEITWASVFDDVPVTVRGEGEESIGWPQNADHIYRGLTDVQGAISRSTNTVAVRILHRLGQNTSFSYLRDTLGMHSLISEQRLPDGRMITDCGDAALALGQMNYGVTLRELTAGYTAPANGGVYMEPRSYYRVLAPDGRVLLSRPEAGQYAMSEQNACILTKLLESVVSEGTGRAARLYDGQVAVAGKTGTSGEGRDRYFIGYTPKVLCGVWYGSDTPGALSTLHGNPAVDTFREVMERGLADDMADGTLKTVFDVAPGVIRVSYCRDSGGVPTEACRSDPRGNRCRVGYFVQGSEPGERCGCHVMAAYDLRRRCPADALSAEEDLECRGLLRWSREVPPGLYVADEHCCLPTEEHKNAPFCIP